MTRRPPHTPSLKEIGLPRHFANIGLDYDLFHKLVATDVKPGAIRQVMKKPGGALYSLATIKSWIKLEQYLPKPKPKKPIDLTSPLEKYREKAKHD